MASTALDLNNWQETLKHRLPPWLRAAFEGGSKRELLKQIDTTLVLFDDKVINLGTGVQATFQFDNAQDYESLVQACIEVIDDSSVESNILLLLPPGEFVATTVAMPGLAREALVSALQLQADSMLPSIGEKLTLAVNPLHSDTPHHDIALWISESRLENLFQAFATKQIFLASVMPRPMVLADESGCLEVIDSDVNSFTCVEMENGALTKWLHVKKTDLEQDIFAKQWQQSIQGDTAQKRLEITVNNLCEIFQGQESSSAGSREYYFFPLSAMLAKRQIEKGKRLVLTAASVAVVAFICVLPFLAQSFEIRRLEARLDSQRELSQNARDDRLVVQNFDDEWGLINDFPQQNVREAMFTLQSVLSPEQLSSLELSEGIIRIEGESVEPQAILQRLEQNPMFTEVTFSRATNNSRYYIDLRLSTVNFEGYMVRYFPD